MGWMRSRQQLAHAPKHLPRKSRGLLSCLPQHLHLHPWHMVPPNNRMKWSFTLVPWKRCKETENQGRSPHPNFRNQSILLILKILHDLNIQWYHNSHCIRYLGSCRISSIHRISIKPSPSFGFCFRFSSSSWHISVGVCAAQVSWAS